MKFLYIILLCAIAGLCTQSYTMPSKKDAGFCRCPMDGKYLCATCYYDRYGGPVDREGIPKWGCCMVEAVLQEQENRKKYSINVKRRVTAWFKNVESVVFGTKDRIPS